MGDYIPQRHDVGDYGSAEIDFLKFEDTESITGLPVKVIAHGKKKFILSDNCSFL